MVRVGCCGGGGGGEEGGGLSGSEVGEEWHCEGGGLGVGGFFLDGGVCVMNAFAIEGVGFVVDEVEVEVAVN